MLDSLEIILCKSVSDNNESQEEYIQYLQSAGYSCYVLPTLCFEFVNLEDLQNRLSKPYLYSGLILTSARSVEAIKNATKQNIPDTWKKLPAYCVGPTTESLARSNLKLEACEGSHCGNSKNLAEYIIKQPDEKTDKPLLYPCSVIARDTLDKILISNNIKLEKIIVYKTLPSQTLRSDLKRLIKPMNQIFVFFSPSTVEYLLNAAKESSISLTSIKSVAIGPVTGEALTEAGLTVFAIAEKPEPCALLEAVKKVEIKMND
ncbi:uroporphyrinogen-III synthase [Chelonus insularis]|uniref:uroporphyrinogen-III synthase n=1 Tax=Chelonus insularis TaxID=460826 RepID=UPI00158BE924|nr:uroporphyrinogen-III synthase [Chelonus insularis]